MKKWLRILLLCNVMIIAVAATGARNKDDADKAPVPAGDKVDVANLKCPKCQNVMQDGFFLDQQGYDAQHTNSLWIEGPVKKKFVGGIETKIRRPIIAYRCTNCGFLELYAK